MKIPHVPMGRLSCRLLASAALLALGAQLAFALPAFPGAEGFGVDTVGARGGTVYHVTNLNDSGAGSFRDAVSVANRTVVFDVGGIIVATSPIVFKSNLTIAGQTAPGEGITIYGDRVGISGVTNLIMRYIRVREGINGDSGTDAISADTGDHMIFDHVSTSWGRDETFSFNGSASNITIQDCIIGQGLLVHSAGGLIQTSGGVSIFRTLYTDNYMRNPKVKGVNDYQNNVVYNWGGGGGYIPAGDSAGFTYANMIGCYFIAGPTTIAAGEGPFKTGNDKYSLYHAGNFQDMNVNGALDGTAVTDASFPTLTIVPTQFAYNRPATLLTAQQAYAHIVAYAGASLHRDYADTYMLNELTSLGTIGAQIFNESDIGGVGTVAGGLAPLDTDGDGMPDWWESAAGTNPLVADNNGDINGDGYTNLENYLNAIAPAGVPAAKITGIVSDSGSSSSDGVTNDPTIKLNGTAAPGASVTVYRVDNTTALATVIADPSGNWVFDYTGTPLADRYYAFYATVDLGGGKISPPTRVFVVKIDTAAAAAPAITSIVLTPSVTLNGTSEPGSVVNVTLSGVGIVATAVTDGLGNWTAPYTGAPLAPGAYTFTAAAIDVAGNPGPDSSPYLVDTSLAAPIFTSITTDTGASSTDRITNDTTLTLNGTSAAGATISVTRVGVGVIGTTVANGSGAWAFVYGTTLPAGVHTFTATAANGGNSSAASEAFVVTIDTTKPVVSSIRRQNPTTSATTVSTLVFRVTFSEPVSGVDLADFALTNSGATATLSTVTPVSSTIYDVTVTGATGDGSVRLDLKASGTGIVDVAGNAIAAGFTTGQTYTIRLLGSGVWIATESGEVWSQSTDWEAGVIASGIGATADFSALNIDGPISVQLDSARTLGRIVFGDTDFTVPALWTLSNNGSAANTLTLSGTSPNIVVNGLVTTGDTVDVPAANAFPSTLDVVLAGSSGFTKTGVGTILLTKPNTITGPLTVTKGVVEIGAGGSLAPSNVVLATSQQLRVSGGTFNTAGDVTWTSGTGTGIIVSAGVANFQKIIPTNTRNSFFRVSGGTVTGTEITFPRSADSEAAATTATGILITGGDTTFGTVGLGTVDSWGNMNQSGGTFTVTGALNVGFQKTDTRGGFINLSGGTLNALDTVSGLVLGRNPTGLLTANNGSKNVAKLNITGGVANLGKILLGFDATSAGGSSTITLASAELNVGTGGIVKNGTAALVSSITLNSGTLGAVGAWATTHPIILAGTPATFALRGANSGGTPFDFALNGIVSGTGFAKIGGGTVTLGAANTFTGDVAVNAGTLAITGSVAAGGTFDINAGGSLAGTGTVNRALALNSGGTIAPAGVSAAGTLTATSATWNGGGTLAVNLGTASDKLVLSGALTKGSAGSYTIAVTPGAGFATSGTYTLATFTATPFVAADFTVTGLGSSSGTVVVTGTSLQLTVTSPFDQWAASLPAGQRGPGDDPDGDGIPNGLEFVLGQNALLATGAEPVATTVTIGSDTYPAISFIRRHDLGGATAEVRVSASLDFTGTLGSVEVSAISRGDGTDDVIVRSIVPLSVTPRQFFRITATLP